MVEVANCRNFFVVVAAVVEVLPFVPQRPVKRPTGRYRVNEHRPEKEHPCDWSYPKTWVVVVAAAAVVVVVAALTASAVVVEQETVLQDRQQIVAASLDFVESFRPVVCVVVASTSAG